MDRIILALFLGSLQTTSYRSVPKQTKPDHCQWTSIGDHVCQDGVAVSQDLLVSGRVRYGDWLYIEGIGLKRVNDAMNVRHKNRLDVWVRTYAEEKSFDRKFKGRKLNVWILNLK